MFTEEFMLNVLGIVDLVVIFSFFFVMSFDRLTRGRLFSRLIIISSIIHFLMLWSVNESSRSLELPLLYVIAPLLIILFAFYRGVILMRILLAPFFVGAAALSVFILFGMSMGFIPDSSDDVLFFLLFLSFNVISNSLLAIILIFSSSLTQFQHQQRTKASEAKPKA